MTTSPTANEHGWCLRRRNEAILRGRCHGVAAACLPLMPMAAAASPIARPPKDRGRGDFGALTKVSANCQPRETCIGTPCRPSGASRENGDGGFSRRVVAEPWMAEALAPALRGAPSSSPIAPAPRHAACSSVRRRNAVQAVPPGEGRSFWGATHRSGGRWEQEDCVRSRGPGRCAA